MVLTKMAGFYFLFIFDMHSGCEILKLVKFISVFVL